MSATDDAKLRQLMMSMSEAIRTIAFKVPAPAGAMAAAHHHICAGPQLTWPGRGGVAARVTCPAPPHRQASQSRVLRRWAPAPCPDLRGSAAGMRVRAAGCCRTGRSGCCTRSCIACQDRGMQFRLMGQIVISCTLHEHHESYACMHELIIAQAARGGAGARR